MLLNLFMTRYTRPERYRNLTHRYFRYEDIEDQEKLLSVMEEGLEEYNAQTRNTMSLVLFSYAAQHVLRISRIIRQPYGNALLVGVGGGGRQSLTRLATFMAGFGIFQIEITKLYGIMEWREDLKVIAIPG